MQIVDWKGIEFYFGKALLLLALSFVIPFITSIVLEESTFFVTLTVITMIVLAMTGYLLVRKGFESDLNFIDSMILTALTFMTAGIAAGVPILAYDTPINSMFEGVSAITTTGLSSLNTQALTLGVQFLRAYYQWIGGLGIALMLVSFLVTPGTAAYTIYAVHLGGEKIKPLSSSTVKTILRVYVLLTIVYFTIYIAIGLSPFTAIVDSMTTVSTGGFSTIQVFKNPVQQAVTLILMFSSAQPLILYYYLYRGMTKKILRETQLFSFTVISVAGIILLAIVEKVNPLSLAFQVVSALSTTGYTSLDNSVLSSFGKLILSILMIIGAGYGSTGGGIKQVRLIIILKHLFVSLKRRLLPSNTILNIKVGGRKIGPSELSQVFTLILLYMTTLVVSVSAFTAFGYSLADSLFESSSALATTGLSVGIAGPTLHPLLKLLLMIDMLMGRVEIIPFIYLFIVPLVRGK